MQDQIFGEINQEDSGWHGEYLLDLGGAVCSVEILIRSEDEIAESQRDAFQCFIEKWPDLNEKLIEALIGYYNKNPLKMETAASKNETAVSALV